MHSEIHKGTWLILMAAFVSSGCAAAQEVTVMSSNGFAASYKLIAPVFETASGAHLKSIWGPSMGPSPGVHSDSFSE
jgi:molybdate transport system substrate-binding protein